MTQWHRIGMAVALAQAIAMSVASSAPAQLTDTSATSDAHIGPSPTRDAALPPEGEPTLELSGTLSSTSDPFTFVRLNELVESLGHRSFHRRRSAAETLLAMSQIDSSSRFAVVNALKSGRTHGEMEVRISSARLMESITLSVFDQQVESLLNPRVDSAAIRLTGWKTFAEMAGTDFAARSLFARVALRHGSAVGWIESGVSDVRSQPPLDPYRIESDDALTWALAIAVASSPGSGGRSQLHERIRESLSNQAMGPRLSDRNDAAVVRRLIGYWVTAIGGDGSSRDRLLIAMRFACHEQAREICDDLFERPNVPPSCLATALLCASVLQRPTLEDELRRHLDDDRTAHVWQLIASRRTRIRTLVSDVALALLLRQHGIDPRSVGFQELQADPIWIYRDHSLGFSDDDARREAYRRAARALGERQPG